MKRWLKRIALGIVTLAVVAAGPAAIFVLSFRGSVPAYDGSLTVAGLTQPVEIIRDAHAIPHILAGNDADAAFGLGFVHAQDRLWQMEISRRYVQGRLSELFGEQAFETDVELRRLGVYAATQSSVQHLSRETRALLEAYAAGVNAFLATHDGPLPIEFTFAGITPEPWQPADSVAIIKGMAMSLSGNAGAEAERIRLLAILGEGGIESFLSPFADGPVPGYISDLFGTVQVGRFHGIPEISASNNWVVDGAHSISGKPLLANDPHLGFGLPSTWYLAHMATPDRDLVGGTLAGVPAIIGGRNRHVAWGMTNTGPDTEDLYIERVNPENDEQYLTPNGWTEFVTRSETIRVRFGGEETILVRETRHGPVMEGEDYDEITPPDHVLALSWTALSADDTSLEAILGINHAASAEEMRAAADLYVTPMQNIVYADASGVTGRIGLMLPGRIPLRTPLNDSLGLFPAPGWDARYDWQGYIPTAELPHYTDSVTGRFVTANNKTVADDYPHILTREWDGPWRHDRIDKLLASTSLHDVESFSRIQLDTVDTYAVTLKRFLTESGPLEGRAAEAAALLGEWDGTMHRDRPEPLLFAAWARALSPRLYADELGEAFEDNWGYREDFMLRVLQDVDGSARWCDDRTTQDSETCAQILRLALDDALAELTEAYGADMNAWRWGDAHISVHSGRPFADFPLIGSWFTREAVIDGGAFTVLRADHRMRSPRPYAAVHGAGYRGIYDLGRPDDSLYMISTGQSGNPYSAHYDDLLPLWAEGGYVEIPTARERIAAEAAYTLTLNP
jgi:penicillin amidase